MKPQNLIHILMAIVCFALSPQSQAANTPDTPDPGSVSIGNTADGQLALTSLTTGIYDSAFGFYSLLSNSDASFNTGVGAGTLLLSNGTQNTATGAGALLSNAIGNQNTANGAFALFNNTEGDENTAVGDSALFTNTTGVANVAIGDAALNNADSVFNTAVGFSAGQGPITGSENIYLGDTAGTLDLDGIAVPDESQTTRIGSLFTEGGLAGAGRCFIGGIRNNGQAWNGVTVCQVTISIDGQLGVDCLNPAHLGGFNQSAPQAPVPHSAPQPRSAPQQPAARPQFQAMNDKVEKLQATVAQQQKQIETLTAQLGEQAAQIQKVSAQLEASKPAPQVVNNDH